MDFTDHRKRDLCFERFQNEEYSLNKYSDIFYAYGIMINPMYSNVIGLDFDKVDWPDIKNLIYNFIQNYFADINQIDIVLSSLQYNYHIYIGLSKYFKIGEIINTFPRVCSGFKSFSEHNNETVLRVSQKFWADKESNPPVIYYIIKKENNKFYSTTNIMYPISSFEIITQEVKEKKLSLNLRK